MSYRMNAALAALPFLTVAIATAVYALTWNGDPIAVALMLVSSATLIVGAFLAVHYVVNRFYDTHARELLEEIQAKTKAVGVGVETDHSRNGERKTEFAASQSQ